jgi:hypothetical protein
VEEADQISAAFRQDRCGFSLAINPYFFVFSEGAVRAMSLLASAQGAQLSLREVSKHLAAHGFLNELGKPYAAKSIASMLR